MYVIFWLAVSKTFALSKPTQSAACTDPGVKPSPLLPVIPNSLQVVPKGAVADVDVSVVLTKGLFNDHTNEFVFWYPLYPTSQLTITLYVPETES